MYHDYVVDNGVNVRSATVKDLGVICDCQFTYKDHVETLYLKEENVRFRNKELQRL